MLTRAQQLGITDFPYKEYDKKGKVTYYERGDGYWWRAEYHTNGFETLVEFSNGLFLKREFDKKGRQIYLETCTGIHVDDRNKEIKRGRPKKTN
jgi:hypothetical protein